MIGDTARMGAARPTVFVCYSSSDRNWCDRVCNQLATLASDAGVEVWCDQKNMRAGDKLHDEITAAIDRSEIAVLLISDAFNDTDRYARKHEVPRIVARAERGELIMIPLHVAESALSTDATPWHGSVAHNAREQPLTGLNDAEAIRVLAALEARVRECLQLRDDARPAFDWASALVRGVSAATAERVRAFIHEYISTPKHVVAFGGRRDTLAALGAWVDDDAAPQHCFLVAPTGLGKSAVVCHFVQALAARGDVAVAFLPVSLRFGTSHAGALREALVDRLLRLHDDRPLGQAGLDATLAALSEKLRRPLPDGRRLVVVIDGLDEAADWEFGAGQLRELADRTKVLISTRGAPGVADRTLRDRLALPVGAVRVGTLAPLDSAEIREALYRAGWADLASNLTRLSRIVELSEGDPLVLHLLLDELSERGEDEFFASGPDLRPGLRGLWERQLTEEDREAFGERGATTSLFAILACSLGPVGGADLMALAPDDLPGGGVLAPVLRRWHRFVLRTEAGYSFFYPRLQQFYAEEMMSAADRGQWQKRLLDHGRTAIANLAATPRVASSPFVLQFHGAHLDRYGGPLDDFAMLVTPAWRGAWAEHADGDAGFVRDVERACVAATKAFGATTSTAPALAVVVRSTLTRGTLRSERRNLTPPLLQALLTHQVWTPTSALAHLSSTIDLAASDAEQHVQLFAAIRPFLRTGSLQLAGLDVAARLARRGGAFELWQELAAALGSTYIDALERSARDAPHQPYRLRALLMVADAHPDQLRRAGLQREVAEQVRASTSTFHLVASLEAVSAHLAALDTPEREALLSLARSRIAEMQDHDDRARLSRRLAEHLHGDDRARFARDAYDALGLDDPPDAQGLLGLLPLLSADEARVALDRLLASAFQAVVSLLRGEVSAVKPVDLWRSLTPHLDAEQRDLLVAAWISGAIAPRWPRLEELVEVGFADEVLPAVRELPSDRRDPALADLGPYLDSDEQLGVVGRLVATDDHPVGLLDPLVDLLSASRPDELLLALMNGGDPATVAHYMLRMAARVDGPHRAACVARVRAAAHSITDALERIRLQADALALVPEADACAEIAAELDKLPSADLRAAHFYLATALERLPPAPRDDLARRLTRASDDTIDWRMPDAPARLRAVGRLGLARVQAGQPRVDAALHLSRHLHGTEARAAVQDALAAAREINDRATAIATVVRLGPDVDVGQRALVLARTVPNPTDRFTALTSIATSSLPSAAAAHQEALDLARHLVDGEHSAPRAYLLRHTTPTDRESCVARLLLEVKRGLQAGGTRGLGFGPRDRARHVLEDIAGYLSPAQAAVVLDMIPRDWTAHVLFLLQIATRDAAYLPLRDARLPEIIEDAYNHALGRDAQVLAAVAPLLEAPRRDALIDDLLALLTVVRDGALHQLAPHLGVKHLARVSELLLDTAVSGPGLAKLVSRLGVPSDVRLRFAEGLYEAARARGDRATIIVGLLPHLPDRALGDVVDALARSPEKLALELLVGQATRFTTPQLDRLFILVRNATRTGKSRPHDVRVHALADITAERLRRSRADAGVAIDVIRELLDTRATDRVELLNAIAGLAPLLRELVGPAGIDAIAGEILDVTEWWP